MHKHSSQNIAKRTVLKAVTIRYLVDYCLSLLDNSRKNGIQYTNETYIFEDRAGIQLYSVSESTSRPKLYPLIWRARGYSVIF